MEETQGQLRAADGEAASLQSAAEAKDAECRRREQLLEAELCRLRSELEEEQAQTRTENLEREAALRSIQELQRLMPEKQVQITDLKSSQQSLRDKLEKLKATADEAESALERQVVTTTKLRESIAQ